jgi:hypothetical protein
VDCSPWAVFSYDPAGPETFTEITLAFDGQRYPDDLVGDRLLTDVEVTQRVTPLSLRPVEQVLTDLGQLGCVIPDNTACPGPDAMPSLSTGKR